MRKLRPTLVEMENKQVKKYRFRRWFRSWLYRDEQLVVSDERQMLVTKDESLDSDPMVLKIYRASGGTVVETRKYDRVKDRSHNQLHIITHDQDLGDSIGKIITMESLRG